MILAAHCEPLREIRRAAGATRAIRLTLAIGHLTSTARVEMSAALLAAQALSAGRNARRRVALTVAITSG